MDGAVLPIDDFPLGVGIDDVIGGDLGQVGGFNQCRVVQLCLQRGQLDQIRLALVFQAFRAAPDRGLLGLVKTACHQPAGGGSQNHQEDQAARQ